MNVKRGLNLNLGDRVEFVQIAPCRCELVASTREVGDLKGTFGTAKEDVSSEDMNAPPAAVGASNISHALDDD